MKQQIIITILAVIAIVAGCKKDNLDTYYTPDTNAITFYAKDNWGDTDELTKGAIKHDFGKNDKLGVYAHYLSDGEGANTGNSTNFMSNQELTKQSDGSWRYDPIKY